MTLGAKGEEVLHTRPRTLSRIQAHRRIERVRAPLLIKRVMKSGAGKALKKNHEDDGAGVNKFNISNK